MSIKVDCSCAGQLIDCEGIPGGISLPGSVCDDGDILTANDQYDTNCNCSGQAIDCLGTINGNNLPGVNCDDGNANTLNDVYQSDCTCAGILLDCEGVLGGPALPGTSCDDGNVSTLGDTYDASCNCSGILCDPTDPGQDCDSDGDGIPNSVDLDDDNDGLFDYEEVEFLNVQFTYSNTIPPDGQSTSFNIDLSAYNLPIGTIVSLSDFLAEGNLNGNSEYFELDFNNGDLIFSQMDTDEKCQGMDPILGNPSGSVTAIDIGNGIAGISVTGTSSPGVNVIPSCSVISIEFDLSASATLIVDTDSDGTPDQFDTDSDDDGCFDVAEAGFTDGDMDGLLGTSPVSVDQDGLVISGSDGYTGNQSFVTDPTTANCTIAASIKLFSKVFLEGPYDANTGLMHDSLRAKGLIPMNEPYSQLGYVLDPGAQTSIATTVLDMTGNDAIVDWVLIELRPLADPTTTESIITGLLQRDGDIVNPANPQLPVEFDLPIGHYHIVIRHRNHLGCMTFNAVNFSSDPTIDFTSFILPLGYRCAQEREWGNALMER